MRPDERDLQREMDALGSGDALRPPIGLRSDMEDPVAAGMEPVEPKRKELPVESPTVVETKRKKQKGLI